MKKFVRYFTGLSAIVVLAFTTSCKKALEEKSFSFITPNNFYQNESDAKTAINGVYNELYTYDLYLQPFWNLTVLDDDHVSGADWFLGNSGAGNPQGYWGVDRPWNGCYTMISRANTVLEKVDAITDIDPDVKKRILGEAHFLRGWAYFQLVQLYGGVPLRVFALSAANPETNVPRSTVKETYDVVINDFKEAETLLFPATDPKSGEAGRATRGLAKAFLAKTYLTMASGALSGASITVRGGTDNGYYSYTKNVVAGLEGIDSKAYYTLARDKALEVIQSNDYSLFTDFKDVFTKGNRNKQEHMWEIQSLAGTDFVNDMHAYFSARSPFGTGAVWMSNNHYKDYEDADTRVLDGVTHRYQANWGTYYYYPSYKAALYSGIAPDGTNYNNNGGTDDKAFITKFSDVADASIGTSDAFFPLMRYAEVLLMYAEAENEVNGPTPAAYDRLNAIRTRAKTIPATPNMNISQFRSYVLEERGREFSLESIRRFDLVRWGIYLQVMNKISQGQDNIPKVRSMRNLLLPIPLNELNSNTAITANNPGW
ncbi:MAG TPA: RagB/SusD family nutrient uptake outer membrane protein [Chitinophagaceae bacterium]|nr:RagB/SusD family nutrient uptake outer membrane protein [Chitinophagaceae bacterium]